MLVRMFGLFGAILALGYLMEGVAHIRPTLFALVRRADEAFVWKYTMMALDLSFGISLLIAAIGLLFVKEWARKMWLIATSALVLVHLTVMLIHEVYGRGVRPSYMVWTWLVALSTALAWWYFNKPSTRALFVRKDPHPETESVNPAA